LAIKSEDGNGMKEVKDDMDKAMVADSAESELREIHSEISNVQTPIKTKKFEKMLKIRKILSAEQRKTFFFNEKENG